MSRRFKKPRHPRGMLIAAVPRPCEVAMDTASGSGIAAGASTALPGTTAITLVLNGASIRLDVAPWTTLLDALREQLGLTGTKKGCDHGQCGACTVLANGKPVLSCLTLALTAEGHEVVTIEGLARPDGSLHPVQQAFIDHDGFQCGYCTPGQIMSAVACIEGGHAGSEEQIR